MRLLWIGLVHADQVYDWIWYYQRGVSIASGHGYYVDGIPTAYWPAGYPGFLGGLFYLVDPHVLAGQIANIVEWLATILLTYFFMKKVFHSEIAARLAVLILSFHPNTIAYASELTADMFLAFLLMLGAVLFVEAGGPLGSHGARGTGVGRGGVDQNAGDLRSGNLPGRIRSREKIDPQAGRDPLPDDVGGACALGCPKPAGNGKGRPIEHWRHRSHDWQQSLFHGEADVGRASHSAAGRPGSG